MKIRLRNLNDKTKTVNMVLPISDNTMRELLNTIGLATISPNALLLMTDDENSPIIINNMLDLDMEELKRVRQMAIYRNRNLDRYDDRLIVETNLIEVYDLLMEFIAKHTDDRFFLIDNVNTSVRNIISREVVSNILVHREFGSAFPTKLIIEKDRIDTENWNRSLRLGKIEPQTFTPYPKNPILAKFFMNIGRADTLGSGVRNLYKYTKIYSGGEQELKEAMCFKSRYR